MSGHRVELRVRFTADDREAAEGVVQRLGHLNDSGEFSEYAGSFEVIRGTVDGIGWDEKWPDEPAAFSDTTAAGVPAAWPWDLPAATVYERCGYRYVGGPGAYGVSVILGESLRYGILRAEFVEMSDDSFRVLMARNSGREVGGGDD